MLVIKQDNDGMEGQTSVAILISMDSWYTTTMVDGDAAIMWGRKYGKTHQTTSTEMPSIKHPSMGECAPAHLWEVKVPNDDRHPVWRGSVTNLKLGSGGNEKQTNDSWFQGGCETRMNVGELVDSQVVELERNYYDDTRGGWVGRWQSSKKTAAGNRGPTIVHGTTKVKWDSYPGRGGSRMNEVVVTSPRKQALVRGQHVEEGHSSASRRVPVWHQYSHGLP